MIRTPTASGFGELLTIDGPLPTKISRFAPLNEPVTGAAPPALIRKSPRISRMSPKLKSTSSAKIDRCSVERTLMRMSTPLTLTVSSTLTPVVLKPIPPVTEPTLGMLASPRRMPAIPVEPPVGWKITSAPRAFEIAPVGSPEIVRFATPIFVIFVVAFCACSKKKSAVMLWPLTLSVSP